MSPILEPNTLEFFSRSPNQTRRVGMRLGALLQTGDVICLDGDLGAGKTTFAQGLAAGWGSTDQVSSPTFVLVNTYRRPDSAQTLYHLDAYRLSGAAEALDLDLETMFATGPVVVEWAGRITAALPRAHLWVNLRWVAEEHRAMQFSARGTRFEALLARFQKDVYGVR